MARYKGCASAKIIERDFPHIVEIAVPPGGLGKRLDKMYDWHRARSIQDQRGSSRREEGRDFISWCFADSRRRKRSRRNLMESRYCKNLTGDDAGRIVCGGQAFRRRLRSSSQI